MQSPSVVSGMITTCIDCIGMNFILFNFCVFDFYAFYEYFYEFYANLIILCAQIAWLDVVVCAMSIFLEFAINVETKR